MSAFVFAVVMAAAALHAGWNAVVKGGADKMLTTGVVTSSAALIATVCLPFLPPPARPSWPFIGASIVLQILYFGMVARTYRVADMSQTYPLMRGAAPLLVAIASTFILNEPLKTKAWLGVWLICLGIISMMAVGRSRERGGVWSALFNAFLIAGYTLVDGVGVRRSGSPIAYTLWLFLLTGLPIGVGLLIMRRAEFPRYARRNWLPGVIGGFGTVSAYGLSLWAMTVAPVAVVAALRETSILFAMAISGIILREKLNIARLVSACVIAGGAVILRLA